MSSTQIRGLQLRLGTLGRDRIDAAFEASLAAIESNITSIFNTMSTDAERMAAVEALTLAFQNADGTLQGAITSLVNSTRAGAGLESDGSFAPGVTNYLGASASLKAATLALDAALKLESDARVAADAALTTSINALVSAGGATAAADLAAAVAAQAIVDAAQNAALAAEAVARTNADTGLQTQVTNEVNARTLLNTTLSTAIAEASAAATAANSAEATTRAAADTVLQSNIDAEALARTTADGIHTASISQEVSDRTAAVSAEAATRAAADAALDGRVVVLESAVAGQLTYDKLVTRETPVGVVDGVNAVFTLANVPYVGTETVFLNGLMLEPGAENDYQLVGKDITLTAAPLTGDRVKVSYFR
jgi:hypothetical protein